MYKDELEKQAIDIEKYKQIKQTEISQFEKLHQEKFKRLRD